MPLGLCRLIYRWLYLEPTLLQLASRPYRYQNPNDDY